MTGRPSVSYLQVQPVARDRGSQSRVEMDDAGNRHSIDPCQQIARRETGLTRLRHHRGHLHLREIGVERIPRVPGAVTDVLDPIDGVANVIGQRDGNEDGEKREEIVRPVRERLVWPRAHVRRSVVSRQFGCVGEHFVQS